MFALVKNEPQLDSQGNVVGENTITIFPAYVAWYDKDGVQHSPDTLLSMTQEQKQDLGIYDVAYQDRPDDRFYLVSENAPVYDAKQKIVKITYTSVARGLEDTSDGGVGSNGLKTQWLLNVKDTANKILAQTDWMLVRKIERNVDIPETVAAYRSSVISEVSRLETAINGSTTVEQLISAVNSISWPEAE